MHKAYHERSASASVVAAAARPVAGTAICRRHALVSHSGGLEVPREGRTVKKAPSMVRHPA